MAPRAVDNRSVRDYWERHPAGYDELKALEGDPLAFLEERDRQTRLLLPNVAEKYRMRLAKDAMVLDIGCGQGYNAQELVRHGARLTAVDLTQKGVELAVQRFRLRELEGNFMLADAQQLPFKDGTFSYIHSSGVVHHIPKIEEAVQEVHRVLRPGGKASIMVYHKASWRYWYRVQFRLRLFMTMMFLAPGWMRRLIIRRRPGLEKYVPTRWPSSVDVLNAGTDFGGVENPLSRVYTRRSAEKLFHQFKIEGFSVSGEPYKPFKMKKNPWERLIATLISRLNERFGWYLFVYLEK